MTPPITSYCEECGKGLTEDTLILKTVFLGRSVWGRELDTIVVCKGRCQQSLPERFRELRSRDASPAEWVALRDAQRTRSVVVATSSSSSFSFVGKLKDLMRKLKALLGGNTP